MDDRDESRKLSKLDEPDMQDAAGEISTNCLGTYSYVLLHIEEQRPEDQL